ncbi:hypothetical protein K7432_012747 [Basidiobolus ranarum]|uniref:Proline-tRNA ligase class II C-terminal domain-containing protein n=1 Tax=Basidiobolus ranarum TaxID=34480 RepID=A0ABR2VRT7_9FUNG
MGLDFLIVGIEWDFTKAESIKQEEAPESRSAVVFIDLEFGRGVLLLVIDRVSGLGIKFIEIDFETLPVKSLAVKRQQSNTSKPAAKIRKTNPDEDTVKIGIEYKKDVTFSKWYQQVITKSEMLEYYDVSGCYIIRPLAYSIWKYISDFFDAEIQELGVAWVTRAGSSNLDEPIAIRPASETVIEFLWQEGHTAHLTKELASEEVYQILNLYHQVYEELLAVPVIKDIKSEKEKFTGGLYTTTVGFIPTTGRGIQGATSHCLGQNFDKMFNITVEDPNAPANASDKSEVKKLFVWQNTWGLTTRTISVMVMVHGDDKGLIIPPRVASTQVVVVPCGLTVQSTDADRLAVEEGAKEVVRILKTAGTPLRLEVGPMDLAQKSTLAVRRDNGKKAPIAITSLTVDIPIPLQTIQKEMFENAKSVRDSHIKYVTEWKYFVPALNSQCFVMIPWCEETRCEEEIKKSSSRNEREGEEEDERAPSMGAKSLCIQVCCL